jgi:hypothetical protein
MFSGLPPYQFPICKLCTVLSISGYINIRWRHPQGPTERGFGLGKLRPLDSSFSRKQGNVSWEPMMCFWPAALESMPYTYLIHNLFKNNYTRFVLVGMKKIQ